MTPFHKNEKGDRSSIVITPAMIEAGADILLFFNSEFSDPKEYAEKIYRAMGAVSDSES